MLKLQKQLNDVFGKQETYWDKLYTPSPSYPPYTPMWVDDKTGKNPYPFTPTITC